MPFKENISYIILACTTPHHVPRPASFSGGLSTGPINWGPAINPRVGHRRIKDEEALVRQSLAVIVLRNLAMPLCNDICPIATRFRNELRVECGTRDAMCKPEGAEHRVRGPRLLGLFQCESLVLFAERLGENAQIMRKTNKNSK